VRAPTLWRPLGCSSFSSPLNPTPIDNKIKEKQKNREKRPLTGDTSS